jgi:hypothetical protein
MKENYVEDYDDEEEPPLTYEEIIEILQEELDNLEDDEYKSLRFE